MVHFGFVDCLNLVISRALQSQCESVVIFVVDVIQIQADFILLVQVQFRNVLFGKQFHALVIDYVLHDCVRQGIAAFDD